MSNRIIHIDQAKAIGIMLIIASICLPFYAFGFFMKQYIIKSKFNNRIFAISSIIWIVFMMVCHIFVCHSSMRAERRMYTAF